MRHSSTLSLLLSLFLLISPIQSRQSPTSYCKCICFQNSTIIPLNSPVDQKPPPAISTPSSNPPVLFQAIKRADGDEDSNQNSGNEGPGGSGEENKHHRTLTCSDCNRAFCLDYNLPICKGAKEEDVFTSCFQRDSLKDETVVLLFILLTASLIGWAVLKPWIEKFTGSGSSGSGNYLPVSFGGSGRQDGSRAGNGVNRSNGPSGYRDNTINNPRGLNRNDSGSIARLGGLNS